MGANEDTRKILQDFLAPELRQIRILLDALEKRMDGIDHKMDKLEKIFDTLNRRSEQRHEAVMMVLGRLVDHTEVRERPARLESQRLPQ